MNPPLSSSRRIGKTLITSGLTANRGGGLLDADFDSQIQVVFESVEHILKSHSLSVADIRSTSVYISSMDHFARMNEAYSAFFTPPYPARTTIQCGLFPGVLFEMSIIAEFEA